MDLYDDNGGYRLNWPAQILGLNPIENLWHELDYRIKGCRNHPKSVKELACLLQAEWKKIPLFFIQTLVENEAWFHLHGYVNSQNSRYWCTTNPRIMQERPEHDEKLGVVRCVTPSNYGATFLRQHYRFGRLYKHYYEIHILAQQ
ncbi:transposable element Tc1 transposase [Trichonephila clavipes]|nr:transposable element Tc1 transposase [Trichonephila clavipes]